MTQQEKLVFASPEWVELGRKVLEELVAKHGEEGQKFSICEVFTGAPEAIADVDGAAAWYFYVDGKTARVDRGQIDDAEIRIEADWQKTLPAARAVIEPGQAPPAGLGDPDRSQTGDMSALPPWLLELHNRLAVQTA